MAEAIDLRFTQSSIEAQIRASLKEISSVYSLGPTEFVKIEESSNGSFADGWEKQGLINTAEALECFFIPYFTVRGIRESFWDGELISIDALRSALEYLAVESKNDPYNDGLNFLSGTPYLNFKTIGHSDTASGIERNMDFLDTACFLLPCLLDAKAINAERDSLLSKRLLKNTPPSLLDTELISAMDESIVSSSRMLRTCELGPGSGWTYTDDSLESDKHDHLYFTWNALEALEVLIRYLETAPHLVPKAATDVWGGSAALDTLKSLLREKQSYLSATFLSQDNKDLYVCENRVDFGNEDSNWYYNAFVIMGLLITGYSDRVKLTKAFTTLLRNLKGMTLEKARKKEHGQFLLEGSLYDKHKKDWSERALTPLVIKALARAHQLDEHIWTDVLESFGGLDSFDQLMNSQLKQLAGERLVLTDNHIGNVWASLGGEAIYSIYHTERSIEALTSVYSCVARGRQIKPYYTTSSPNVGARQMRESFAVPQIQVTISPEVIRDSILEEIEKETKKKIKEILDSVEVTRQINDKLADADGTLFKNRIDEYVNWLIENSGADQPDRAYKKSLDAMTELIGKQLHEAIGIMLQNADPLIAKDFDKEDFKARFTQGLGYLLEWETRSKGAIDYGKTFSEMQAKDLIQFKSNNSTPTTKLKE